MCRKLLVIGRLDLRADRIFRRQRLEIIKTARKPFDFRRLVDAERVLVVVDAGQPAAILPEIPLRRVA